MNGLWFDAHIGMRHHYRAIKDGECSQCHYAGTKHEKTHHMKTHSGRSKLFCDKCFIDPFVHQKDLDKHRLKIHCPKEWLYLKIERCLIFVDALYLFTPNKVQVLPRTNSRNMDGRSH